MHLCGFSDKHTLRTSLKAVPPSSDPLSSSHHWVSIGRNKGSSTLSACADILEGGILFGLGALEVLWTWAEKYSCTLTRLFVAAHLSLSAVTSSLLWWKWSHGMLVEVSPSAPGCHISDGSLLPALRAWDVLNSLLWATQGNNNRSAEEVGKVEDDTAN